MRLDHVTIRSTDLDATRDFFVQALGLEVGGSPDIGVPVVWLYAAGRPIVHVFMSMAASAPGEPPADAIDHLALAVDDLTPVKQRLDRLGYAYKEAGSPDAPRQQMFVTAPGGVLVEILSYRKP